MSFDAKSFVNNNPTFKAMDKGYAFEVNTTYLEEKNYEKSETLYRKQFLKIFKMSSYDFKQVEMLLPSIFKALCKNKMFDALFDVLKKNSKLPIQLKDEDLVILLFQYDYFHYFHCLLQKMYTRQDYSKEIQELINKITLKKN